MFGSDASRSRVLVLSLLSFAPAALAEPQVTVPDPNSLAPQSLLQPPSKLQSLPIPSPTAPCSA